MSGKTPVPKLRRSKRTQQKTQPGNENQDDLEEKVTESNLTNDSPQKPFDEVSERQIVITKGKEIIMAKKDTKMSNDEFKQSERQRWQERYDKMSESEKAERSQKQKLRRRRDRAAIHYGEQNHLEKEQVIEAWRSGKLRYIDEKRTFEINTDIVDTNIDQNKHMQLEIHDAGSC